MYAKHFWLKSSRSVCQYSANYPVKHNILINTVVFYYTLQHVSVVQIGHHHVGVGYKKRNIKEERWTAVYSGTRDAGVALANLDREVFSNTRFYLFIVYSFYYTLPCFYLFISQFHTGNT
jgi:hypothetical protein